VFASTSCWNLDELKSGFWPRGGAGGREGVAESGFEEEEEVEEEAVVVVEEAAGAAIAFDEKNVCLNNFHAKDI